MARTEHHAKINKHQNTSKRNPKSKSKQQKPKQPASVQDIAKLAEKVLGSNQAFTAFLESKPAAIPKLCLRQQLQNAAKDMKFLTSEIGEHLSPVLKAVMQNVKEALEKMEEILDEADDNESGADGDDDDDEEDANAV